MRADVAEEARGGVDGLPAAHDVQVHEERPELVRDAPLVLRPVPEVHECWVRAGWEKGHLDGRQQQEKAAAGRTAGGWASFARSSSQDHRINATPLRMRTEEV